MPKKNTQIFVQQETFHEMELALDSFYSTLEPLEEYIGKANYYPNDWGNRRQIYRKVIKDSNDTLEGFEDLFLTDLFCFKGQIRKKDDYFREKLKQEFCKWIDATGITAENCPERLKHFLYEINEVLEGRGEKIVSQTRELIKDQELTPKEALGMFGQLQNPLNKGRDRAEALDGKKWNNESENENKIDGDPTRGRAIINKISQDISFKHKDFDLYSEQKKLRGIFSSQGRFRKLTEKDRQNLHEWNIKEIVTVKGNLVGWGEVKEIALVHKDANLKRYNWQNHLEIDHLLVYLKKEHLLKEWIQIEQYLFGNQQKPNPNYNPLMDDDSEMYIDETKLYEKEWNEALWKKANWKDQDYWDNGETREGLEKWIKELEVRRSIDEWGFYTVDEKYSALIHQSALSDDGRRIIDPSKVYYGDKDLSNDGWIRIENEKKQSQHYNQATNRQVSFSHPNKSNNNFPKPLIFGGLGLFALTIGTIVYKVRKNKLKR